MIHKFSVIDFKRMQRSFVLGNLTVTSQRKCNELTVHQMVILNMHQSPLGQHTPPVLGLLHTTAVLTNH